MPVSRSQQELINEFQQNYRQQNNLRSIELARKIIKRKDPVLELKMIYITTLAQKKSIKLTNQANRELK